MTAQHSVDKRKGKTRSVCTTCEECGEDTIVNVPASEKFKVFKYGRCASCAAAQYNADQKIRHNRALLYGCAQGGQSHA